MLTDDNQKEILTNFIIDNPDLDELESMLSAFNIFEAVGMMRQEIRHSHFLAFLLNPSESHRLSDLLVKRFLICVLANAEEPPINPLEIDLADLDDLEVRREWKNIDILLVSPNNSIVCAIENKVDSDEHSNQLKRYKEIVDKDFLDYQKIFIYLTKDGKFPSKEEDKKNWLTFSYGEIAQIIETILNKYKSTIGDVDLA